MTKIISEIPFSRRAYAFYQAIKRIDYGFTFVLHVDFTNLLHYKTNQNDNRVQKTDVAPPFKKGK